MLKSPPPHPFGNVLVLESPNPPTPPPPPGNPNLLCGRRRDISGTPHSWKQLKVEVTREFCLSLCMNKITPPLLPFLPSLGQETMKSKSMQHETASHFERKVFHSHELFFSPAVHITCTNLILFLIKWSTCTSHSPDVWLYIKLKLLINSSSYNNYTI